MAEKIRAAIIGPGNIGTDLLMKAMRSELIEPVWMVGVDPDSPGLARAKEMGLKVTSEGVDGMLATMREDGVQICFDATSAYVHAENSRKVNEQGALMVDLTPAAIGPYCVPPVNLKDAVAEKVMNVNMVTCGGQATIPMVAACPACSRSTTVKSWQPSAPNLSAPALAKISMSSPVRRQALWKKSAVPAKARRLSSSIRLSRR